MENLLPVLPAMSRTAIEANVGLGCSQCFFLEHCGGIYDAFDCLTTCCRKPKSCRVACPHSERFGDYVADSGGWDKSLATIGQSTYEHLPLYIPLIHHHYSRRNILDEEIVALPTTLVAGLVRRNPDLDGEQIRRIFQLAPTTKLILISVAQDAELESLWRDMRFHSIPSALAKLRILHITSPNFSFPVSLPRTESLTNRSRIISASEQLSVAGLSVIPHLNATHERDWEYWADFLKDRPDIYWVAKEFQTGLKIRTVSRWHIDQFKHLQDRIGRALGLIAVGGRGALDQFVGIDVSVVDSTPFIKATKRHLFTGARPPWALSPLPKGMPIDDHLRSNIKLYRDETERRMQAIRQCSTISQSHDDTPLREDSPRKAVASSTQPSLWPDMYLAETA
jgi:hypothetical protein